MAPPRAKSEATEGSAPTPSALAADLFDEALGPPSSQVPLNPAEFSPGIGAEGPTERIDLEGPEALKRALAASGAPVAGPPEEMQSPEDLRRALAVPGAPAAAPPEELDLGLPLGSGPAAAPPPRPSRGEIGEGTGILGLPMGSAPARSVDSSPPAPRVARLPCTVLVVGEDRASGAQIASQLMGYGYTCRVVVPHEAGSVLQAESIQVAVLDLPPELADPQQFDAVSRVLGGWAGATVLLAAASLPAAPRRGWSTLSKPFFDADLVDAVELAREDHAAAGPGVSPPAGNPMPALPGPAVARAESLAQGGHFELSDNMVRALVVALTGATRRGRVRSMSYAGQMLVDIHEPILDSVPVDVEITLVDGRRGQLSGRVTRSGPAQVMIELEVPATHTEVLRQFIDEARDITQPTIEQVRIRERGRASAAEVPVMTSSELVELFDEAAAAIEDDALQQSFIQACIKADRLQFAVQCYRELKADRPGDERVARYLNQVGTILGFYALRKDDGVKIEDGMPRGLKWALGLFILAALVLWVLVEVLAV